jgi:sugar phosphate permease
MIAAIVISVILPDCDQCWIAAVPPIMLGVSYSVSSVVLYPQIAINCDANVLGTAYGITSVLVNLGNAIISPVMGYIEENTQEHDHGFFWVYIMFLIVAIAAFLCNLFSLRNQRSNE